MQQVSILLSILFCLSSSCMIGQSAVFTDEEGVALLGYDIVAYHTAHQAIHGSKIFFANYLIEIRTTILKNPIAMSYEAWQ